MRSQWGLAAIALLAALVALARTSPPFVTDADIAVAELYTELATHGELSVGPYSRFGWNHPGPLYFYLVAPLYVLADRNAAALFAGALAINLLAILTIGLVIAREKRGLLLVLVPAACVLFAWRAPRLLASPWTGHVAVLPALAFVVLCAAIGSGRLGLVPLAAIVGSLVVQTHLGFVPAVVALTAAALAVGLSRRNSTQPRLAWVATWTACVLAAAWWLPLSEAIARDGGNLAALWRFFVTDAGGAGHSLREALIAGGHGLTGVLRPDFALPWGGHFASVSPGLAIAFVILQVVLLAAIGVRDIAGHRRFEGSLSLFCLLATLVSIWSITRIKDDILDHEIFWLSALGALNLAVMAAAAGRLLARGSEAGPPSLPRVATAGCVLVMIAAVSLGLRAFRDFTAFERRRTDRVTITRMYAAVRNYIDREGIRRPLITTDSETWSYTAGVLLRLHQDGTSLAVADDWLPMFTRALAPRGDEDAVISIVRASTPEALRNGSANQLQLDSAGRRVYASRLTPPR